MYKIIDKKISVEDITATTYGIEYTKDGVSCAKINDISLNKAKVEDLANTLNDNNLDPNQFFDVVEDILNDPDFEG